MAAQQELAALGADVMVVAAYGLILPQAVLDTPKYGCLNIHGSLLPRWRGAAPIQRAIATGDDETGITIMQMAAGLDTGDMMYKTYCPITSKIHQRRCMTNLQLKVQQQFVRYLSQKKLCKIFSRTRSSRRKLNSLCA